MARRSFRQLLQFLAIPLAMCGFVLIAAQAGGFVLRKDTAAGIDSNLVEPVRTPPG